MALYTTLNTSIIRQLHQWQYNWRAREHLRTAASATYSYPSSLISRVRVAACTAQWHDGILFQRWDLLVGKRLPIWHLRCDVTVLRNAFVRFHRKHPPACSRHRDHT